MTALLDYIGHTGDCSRFSYVTNTWSNNATLYLGNFRNPFFDDTGWWALAWMRAADIAGSCDPGAVSSLMNTAEIDFDYMQQSGFESASSCGGIGGMWWNTDLQYKASIANGLFLELAGGLYNRTGQTKYLDAAKAGWQWYTDHHVIDPGTGLVIDGYDGPNAQSPKTPCGAHPAHYTYNQGAVIGGLVELYRATSDATYLDRADGIAQATIAGMTTNGILREDSEVGNPNDVGAGDGAIFKGVFTREARPLYDLDARLGRPEASSLAGFLRLQLQSLIPNDRSGWGEYGYHWTGPIRNTSDDNAWTQTSAVDAFNAAAGL